MKTQTFHLGDILSITTGILVSTRHMEGVYDILNFLTNSNLFTHQLPSAADLCRPYLLHQFPQFQCVDASSVNSENLISWLDEQILVFGEYFELQPMSKDNCGNSYLPE